MRVLASLTVTCCIVVVAIANAAAQSKPRSKAASKQEMPSPDAKPIDVATACLARGDDVCLIRVLEGKAQTQRELGLLIETYRAVGEMALAHKHMEQYLKRFPNAQRSTAYQRMLELEAPSSAPQSAPPRPATSTETPLEHARECAADNRCVVGALEGNANTAEELGLLCEAYRSLGDNVRARAAMQQYVQRFPKAQYSSFYRDELERAH